MIRDRILRTALLFVPLALCAVAAKGEDWLGFRGVSNSGISSTAKIPESWGDQKNLKWKVQIPGAGSSSPIVVGDKVFVTAYSGYGVNGEADSLEKLKRHLICYNKSNGTQIWAKEVASDANEDPYRGYITEHGYASSTPVSDGEMVYVFFAKTGVLAFNMSGEQVWKKSLGTRSNSRSWGSASSPVLYKNLVIVNAADEARAIIALDKKTGKEVWKAPAETLDLSFNTPLLVKGEGDKSELVIAVPNEVWGLNPDSGKLQWYAQVPIDGNVSPSLIAHEGVVYACGGFQRKGSAAVKIGGMGDVSKTHVLWTSQYTSYVPSPLYYDGHLYWVNQNGVAHCVNAKTGELLFQERLTVEGGARARLYASVSLAKNRIVVVTRNAGTFILDAATKFKQIANNRFEGDTSQFNGSPAFSGNQMFLRSDKFLYCVESK